MIELMFQKVLMLIRQVHLKSVLYVTIGISRTKSLGFNQLSAMTISCHDVLMMSIDLNNIIILNIHGTDYRCITDGITKSEAVNLLRKMHKDVKIYKENTTFRDIEINKRKFHRFKNTFFLDDVDSDNILIFNKISCDQKNYKYFIG